MYPRQSTGFGVHLQRGQIALLPLCCCEKHEIMFAKMLPLVTYYSVEIDTRDDYHREFKMLPTHPKVPPCDIPRLSPGTSLRYREQGLPWRSG